MLHRSLAKTILTHAQHSLTEFLVGKKLLSQDSSSSSNNNNKTSWHDVSTLVHGTSSAERNVKGPVTVENGYKAGSTPRNSTQAPPPEIQRCPSTLPRSRMVRFSRQNSNPRSPVQTGFQTVTKRFVDWLRTKSEYLRSRDIRFGTTWTAAVGARRTLHFERSLTAYNSRGGAKMREGVSLRYPSCLDVSARESRGSSCRPISTSPPHYPPLRSFPFR